MCKSDAAVFGHPDAGEADPAGMCSRPSIILRGGFMKKFYLLFLAIFAYSMIGCSSIDVAISPKVDVNKKMKKIIVFPFDVKGVRWGDEFSYAITDNYVK